MSVSITLSPSVEAIGRRLEELGDELEHPRWLWELLVPVMVEIEAEQFATEGHGQWAPLDPSTLLQKQRSGFPPNTLIRTGQLVMSLTNPGAAQISDDRLDYGTDVPHAHWHQDGGYKQGRPPQRKVIDLDGAAMAKIQQATDEGVEAVLRRVGL